MAKSLIFFDACVLYPPLVRGILLGAAEAGLFRPCWSGRVLDEWRIAAARNGGMESEAWIEPEIARMGERFPGACVTPDPAVEAEIRLPDPADAHVLAGAIAACANVLLTFNLRDFPTRTLAGHGIVARHPDGFLWELFGREPAAMEGAIRRVAEMAGATAPAEIRRALKRARLSRLGKAWEAEIGG